MANGSPASRPTNRRRAASTWRRRGFLRQLAILDPIRLLASIPIEGALVGTPQITVTTDVAMGSFLTYHDVHGADQIWPVDGANRWNWSQMNEVTRILLAVGQGDANAASKLLPIVYDELRKLAAQKLHHEKAGQTLQATALVHEAYLRLVDGDNPQPFNGRGHFFAAAAEAMRRILIENARRKQRVKHGGLHERVELGALEVAAPDGDALPLDIIALDEALIRLEQLDPTKAQLVKLRFFAGLTLEEAAAALEISPATADRYWAFARAWLFRELGGRAVG